MKADENAPAKQSVNGNSLIVLRNKLEKANKSYMTQLGLKTFNSKSSQADMNAYGQGEAFGDSINLNRNPQTKAIEMR